VHFRKRINEELVNKINEGMVERARKKLELEEKEKGSPGLGVKSV
jgi:hypothetical protein